MKKLLPYIGHIFVAIVSIIGAFKVENCLWGCLLLLSAIVTFTLAINRLITSRKVEKRIKYLENNQLSLDYEQEEETMVVKVGVE